jgi:hypothetical protein
LRQHAADDQIVQLWKELNPSSAYRLGWNQMAGRVFIPTSRNVATILQKVRRLRKEKLDRIQRKVLDSIEAQIIFEEPGSALERVLEAIFDHLTKEGVKGEHLGSLLENSADSVKAARARFDEGKLPLAVRVLAMYRARGVQGIISVIRSSGDAGLGPKCDRLEKEVKEFVAKFGVRNFGEGSFEEVERIFLKNGFDLGRKRHYSNVLKMGFDYDERPEELERKSLSWLRTEKRKLDVVTRELSAILKCGNNPLAVEAALRKRFGIEPESLVETTKRIRRPIQLFTNETVVRIMPGYETKVIETPSYLTGVFPSAAASFFDTFTRQPHQLYFVTTDPKRDPMKTLPELIETLVHEEYGHCVHHHNSAASLGRKLRKIELITTLLMGAVTEGLSFNREWEFLQVIKSLEKKRRFSKAEQAYVSIAERNGGLRLLNRAVEFEVRKWRLVRFLRVIGDVWLNTGKKTLTEFVDWGHKRTGIERSTVFYQLFPGHEGIPGYATTYAVVGEEIRGIEETIPPGEARVSFSTYLCSIGYPPRTLYRKKLLVYARKLNKVGKGSKVMRIPS